ncbi:MAG: TolC family protein [Desulfocapsa sp.]|uniref:TolC family protein n=1 Tax=Desulfotalea psychrophila TaxID=84980 RepID=A0ABS3ASM4_9BACT|nr:TolC family protein [Desulfocapsa sp.]MBN4068121.1 TolC family protein [Desulfotalea psychrophila]
MNWKISFLFLTVMGLAAAPAAGAKTLDEVQVLDLATAQQIALADNPSLAAAAERVKQAGQRIKQARALYYPSIDAGGTAASGRISTADAAQSFLFGGTDIDRNSENYRLSLGASWLLFDGFSRKFLHLVAEYGQQESEQARRDGMRLLLQAVAESFYGAQLALYNKAIAEADFSFNSTQAKEARASLDAGAGSLSAVLNFQVQMNNASTDVLLAERNYDIALFGLALLLGRESGQMPEGLKLSKMVMVEENEFYELSTSALLQAAERNRPDLLLQELSVQRAESTIGANKASYYPQFSLNGVVDGDRFDNANFISDDFGSTVSLNLSYNLFRGGGDRARIAEAKAYKREVVRTLEQQKNKVQSEVRQAITRLEQARAQLLLQRASVKLVEQSRNLVEDGYKAGQESLARLNEVQRDLVRTRSRLALSLISLYTNRQSLKTATGESLIPYLQDEGSESGME